MNVAIEKRENFDAMIKRDVISVQNIDFFDVSIDEIDNTFFERLRTIFDINIEKNKNFDDEKNDEKNEKMIDRNDETRNVNSKTNEKTNC